ncbi:DUF1294 domain-containing protein [Melghirimyces algeriensis]|uniref:Uncharacterized membrane protein YsdA, DUF1294 family n=1 Tax=Melghirimyces algeriensis TaxID=910412 RepID=A0A521B8P7_9BACL|nr:DUF1294 domain-containing protein [Melghirimyces algeriensis]SMO43478.1 Uncharacterized membrane protein YsdA, DUF1294 family [Melghirimyces algeriensis]
MGWLFLYLLIINTVSFFLFRRDKIRAERGQWRISEKVLFRMVLIGGGAGALLAMKKYRHKTQKLGFTWGIPICILIQGLVLFFFLSE